MPLFLPYFLGMPINSERDKIVEIGVFFVHIRYVKHEKTPKSAIVALQNGGRYRIRTYDLIYVKDTL